MARMLRSILDAMVATASNDPEQYCRDELTECLESIGFQIIDIKNLEKAVEKMERELEKIREN